MIIWEKYIQWGDFTSRNGVKLPYKWDFYRLRKNNEDSRLIKAAIYALAYPSEIVAITTVNPSTLRSIKYHPELGYLHTTVKDKYVIYDDVISTGKSIVDCAEYCKEEIGFEPEMIICIVDRRKEVERLGCEVANFDAKEVIKII